MKGRKVFESMNYTVKINGKEIIYGPLITRSHFNDEEWIAIYAEMAKVRYPEFYEKYKDDNLVIEFIGSYINMDDRYEALLNLLPQNTFSKGGTHPAWVAEEVSENTLDRGITQDDVKEMLEEAESLTELKNELLDYFQIKVEK